MSLRSPWPGATRSLYVGLIFVLAYLGLHGAVLAQSLVFLDDRGDVAGAIVEQSHFEIRLTSPAHNQDPNFQETLYTEVVTTGGDQEYLSLWETAPDSGVFVGGYQHAVASPSPYNGFVETPQRSTPSDPVDSLSVTVDALTASVPTVAARLAFQDHYGGERSALAAGEPVYVTVYCPAANLDFGQVDTASALLTSSQDLQTLTLTESGDNSALFSGWILASDQPSGNEDDRLSAAIGDSYQLSFTSPVNGVPTVAQASVVASSLQAVDDLEQATQRVLQGDQLAIRLFDLSATETVQVTVTSLLTGDTEWLTLDAISNSRHRFAGDLPTVRGTASVGNGVLETGDMDTVDVSYGGASLQVSTYESEVTFLGIDGQSSDQVYFPGGVTVRVLAPNRQGDASTTVILSETQSGDQETVQATAIAPGSNTFEATLFVTYSDPEFVTPNNGALEVVSEDIRVVHADLGGGQSSAEGRLIFERTDNLDAWGRSSRVLPLDGPLNLRVDMETDPQNLDQADLIVEGDFITLDETAPDSNLFLGSFTPPSSLGQQIQVFGIGNDLWIDVQDAQVAFLDLLGQPVEAYAVGSTVRMAALAPSRNGDPAGIDVMYIELRNPLLEDSVTLTAYETDVDTGLFTVESASSQDFPPFGGAIQASAGDRLVGTFGLYFGSQVVASVVFVDNHVPVAQDDAFTVTQDASGSADLLANDSDVDGQPLSLLAITQPSNGTAVDNGDGTVLYTPSPGFFGNDSFTYVVWDGEGGQAQASVQVTVEQAVTAPDLMDDSFVVLEDVPTVLDVLANDSLSGNVLDLGNSEGPSLGTLQQNPDNTFTYIPYPDTFGTDSFTYFVVNEVGYDVATVTIDLQPVNDPPTAGFLLDAQGSTDAPRYVGLLAEFYSYDIDDETLTFDWDLGNGDTAGSGDVHYLYTVPGTYNVVLTVTDPHGATGTASQTITVTQAQRSALLVVFDDANLGAGDTAVRDRLLALGYQVTLRSQAASQSSDATGMDVVLISSTVTSSQVNTKFRDVAVPVMSWEPYLHDDMGMTGVVANVNYGSELNQTQLDITATGHPLAAGLSGTVSVLTHPYRLTFGQPGSNASVIATVSGAPSKAVTFGYEAGATMVSLDAPARRLGFFLTDQSAAELSADGLALFDSALCWSVDCQKLPKAVIDAVNVQGVAPLDVMFDGSSSTGGAAPIASYHWDFGDGHSDTEVSTGHSYGVGSYVATLTVTDVVGRSASSSVDIQVTSTAPSAQALFVANSTSLGSADAAIRTRLEGLGYAVQVVAAQASTSADANGKDLVLISSTINSNHVNSKFRDVAVPVITWEAWIYDDMKMTAAGTNVGYGRIDNQPHIVISDSTHPLAAGLSGNVSVVPGTTHLRWGAPSAQAEVAAVAVGNSSRALVFGYNAGADMVGLIAPARRVGLPFYDDNPASFTAEGWDLFDAAVAWATAP